jgi:hypothetical protein
MDETVQYHWRKLENVIEDAVEYLQRHEDGQHLAIELQDQARKLDQAMRTSK